LEGKLPPETVIRVWDLIMLRGKKALMRVLETNTLKKSVNFVFGKSLEKTCFEVFRFCFFEVTLGTLLLATDEILACNEPDEA